MGYNSVDIRDNTVYAKACVESDGRHRVYIWVKSAPLLDNMGNKSGWITSIRDITDKKKAAESLKEVHMREKALLDNIPDMAWIKDETLHYIAVNDAFEKACSRKEEDIVGKTDMDIWPADLAEKYSRGDTEVIRTGRGRCVGDVFDGRRRRSGGWRQSSRRYLTNQGGLWALSG